MALLPMAQSLTGSPYGLDCGRCPREQKCGEWPDAKLIAVWGADIAPPEGSDIPEDWGGRCPASWLSHPEVAAASQLLAASDVSPLAGWPTQYAAWAVETVSELSRFRESERLRAMRRHHAS
jgi:hypothetical protein